MACLPTINGKRYNSIAELYRDVNGITAEREAQLRQSYEKYRETSEFDPGSPEDIAGFKNFVGESVKPAPKKRSKSSLKGRIEVQTIDDAIAETLYKAPFQGDDGIRIKQDSYFENGDRNSVKDDPWIKVNYLSEKGGLPLDQIAMQLKEEYPQFAEMDEQEIIQAIIDFTKNNSKGAHPYVRQRIQEQKNYLDDPEFDTVSPEEIDRLDQLDFQDVEDLYNRIEAKHKKLADKIQKNYFNKNKPWTVVELLKDIEEFRKDPSGYFGPLLGVVEVKDGKYDTQILNDLENAIKEEYGSGAKRSAKTDTGKSGSKETAKRTESKAGQVVQDTIDNAKYTPRRKSGVIVRLPIDLVLENQDPEFAVDRGKNEIGSRIDKAKSYLEKQPAELEASDIYIKDSGKYAGKIGFSDGRHRLIAAKELGAAHAFFEIDGSPEQFDALNYLLSEFGNEGGVEYGEYTSAYGGYRVIQTSDNTFLLKTGNDIFAVKLSENGGVDGSSATKNNKKVDLPYNAKLAIQNHLQDINPQSNARNINKFIGRDKNLPIPKLDITKPSPNKSKPSPKELVSEIKSKPLSHAKGLGMGQNQAEGTYVSTEQGNRYGKADKVEVDISNPLEMSMDDLGELQRKIIAKKFPGKKTVDDLSDKQSQELAKAVTEDVKKRGYDSIYFRESGTQEGELVVFDKDKVKFPEPEKVAPKGLRFEAGSKLTDTQKREVYKTMKDAYKVNNRPRAEIDDRLVWVENGNDYMVTSDITGRKLRWFITLPDGKIAHPTELYPNITKSEIDVVQSNIERNTNEADRRYERTVDGLKTKKQLDDVISAINTALENGATLVTEYDSNDIGEVNPQVYIRFNEKRRMTIPEYILNRGGKYLELTEADLNRYRAGERNRTLSYDNVNWNRFIDEYGDKKIKEPAPKKDKFEGGKDKVASGLNKLANALGAKKNIVEEDADIVEALKEIAEGLMDMGIATIEDVGTHLKRVLKNNGYTVDDKIVDKIYPAKVAPKLDVPKAENVEKPTSSNMLDRLSEEARMYNPITNEDTVNEAERIINAYGYDAVEKLILNPKSDIHPSLRDVIGYNVMDNYAKREMYEDETRVGDILAEFRRELAQGLQAGVIFQKMSVGGKVRSVVKAINEKRASKIKKSAKEIAGLKEELRNAKKEAIESYINSDQLATIIETEVTKELRKQNEAIKSASLKNVASEKVKQRIQKFDNEINSILNDLDGSLHAFGIASDVYKKSLLAIQSAVHSKPGIALHEAIQVGVEYIKQTVKDFDSKAYSDFLAEKLASLKSNVVEPKDGKTLTPEDAKAKITQKINKESPPRKKVQEDPVLKVLKKKIKEIQKKILDDIPAMVKSGTDISKLSESIADAIVRELGLNGDAAVNTKSKIKTAIDEKVKAKTEKVLNKVTNKKVKKSYHEKVVDKILELDKLGLLDDKAVEEAYADLLGFPKATSEQIKKLRGLAEKIKAAPEGEAKMEATEDFWKEVSSINGVPLSDVGTSLWYSFLLSGPPTHVLNLTANANELMGEFMTSTIQMVADGNYKGVSYMAKNMLEGLGIGINQGQRTLKTGRAPIKGTRFEIPDSLEMLEGKTKLEKMAKMWSIVRRAMAAEDVFFYMGLREMRAAQLAYKLAASEKNPTKETWKRADEILGKTAEDIEKFTQKATDEGLEKGSKRFKRRIQELMEQSRKEDIRDDSADFSAHGTFNYMPEGSFGRGVELTNKFIKSFPPFKFVVPFRNIVANVANRYLDYSPYGYVRVAKNGIGWEFNNTKRKYTPEERQRELIKASAGTAVATLLYAMTLPGDDDEPPMLEITANGTGDVGKNYELKARPQGWQEYSIRIGNKWFSYKNTPVAIPLQSIGTIRDMEQYGKEAPGSEKAQLVMFSAFKYFTQMSFLQNVATLFGTIADDSLGSEAFSLKRLWKIGGRIVKGAVVPAVVTQASDAIQQVNDIPTKRADNMLENIYTDLPVLRDNLDNMYNSLGEPVVAESLKRWVPFSPTGKVEGRSKVWKLITENQAWIGRPSKQGLIYDPALGAMRAMTEKEYNAYALKSSIEIRKELEALMSEGVFNGLNKKQVNSIVDKVKTSKRTEARVNMFSQ